MSQYKGVFNKGPKTKAPWYRIEAKADAAEVFIYDEIGLFGVDAQEHTSAPMHAAASTTNMIRRIALLPSGLPRAIASRSRASCPRPLAL